MASVCVATGADLIRWSHAPPPPLTAHNNCLLTRIHSRYKIQFHASGRRARSSVIEDWRVRDGVSEQPIKASLSCRSSPPAFFTGLNLTEDWLARRVGGAIGTPFQRHPLNGLTLKRTRFKMEAVI